MDTIKSFKGYDKVDPAEEAAFRRKTHKRNVITVVSMVLFVAVIIGAVTGAVIHNHKNDKHSGSQVPSQLFLMEAIKNICSQTQYPESCYSSLFNADKSNTTDPEELFKISLEVALDALSQLSSLPVSLMKNTSNATVKEPLLVCKTVINDAVDYVKDCISSIDVRGGEKGLSSSKIMDLRTWLSSVLTSLETCLDALEEMNSTFLVQVKSEMQNSIVYASNGLAIISNIRRILGKFHRKLLGEEMESGFPRWVRPGDRKLLQAAAKPTPNLTVAMDGTGDVVTINEAMAKVPKKSDTRFVIYIKEGRYNENVVLDKAFWNVMVYGDGKYKTIVSASLNRVDGSETFHTATFGVTGERFIAMDMGFRNDAGPHKHQAVAFRSSSDKSVFYRCSFYGYQDTLYSHEGRQFYRECDITGTVDFIFGDAAAVYQNCTIMPRQPLPKQSVIITAQGRNWSKQTTGFSIQDCLITPLGNLTAQTYLGRPWKNFSTTVIMRSHIGSFLNPQGWMAWVPNTLPPDTIFYAEYLNTGPGAAVDKRVNWTGYHPSLTKDQASYFTVESFY